MVAKKVVNASERRLEHASRLTVCQSSTPTPSKHGKLSRRRAGAAMAARHVARTELSLGARSLMLAGGDGKLCS